MQKFKCVAIGDLLIPASAFDADIKNQEWVSEYDSFNWNIADKRDALRNVVRKMETEGSRAFIPTAEELERVKDAEVLMTHLYTVPSELFEAAPRLRFILSCRGGLENIDLKAAKEHGVKVIHCPAHNAYAVAEYAIALMLVESRNIARAHRGLMNGVWIERYPNSAAIPELRGSTVGLIGFGTIGRLVAERLKPFDVRLMVNDPFLPDEIIEKEGCIPASKEELLRQSDFISLHGRIGPNDPPIIGAAELDMMKPSAYLINTARAVLVDMDALYDALKSHKIMGAAIDVFRSEPLNDQAPDYKFLELENVTITNHRGGDTLNSYWKAPEMLSESLCEYLEKGATRFLVRM